SMLSCARSPPIWSHCVPNAANLALENVAQKTINYLPNLVMKCASHHTETSRRINPKCALTSRHSDLSRSDCSEEKNSSLPASKALSKYSRNRRRNSLESTATGKKNPSRQEIHWLPSAERPPPATTQCRWG